MQTLHVTGVSVRSTNFYCGDIRSQVLLAVLSGEQARAHHREHSAAALRSDSNRFV